jgi:hypothetical protein
VGIHIQFLWEGDHAQAIVRAAQVHILRIEQRPICFEAEPSEQLLQTEGRQGVMTVWRKVNDVRRAFNGPRNEAFSPASRHRSVRFAFDHSAAFYTTHVY